MNIKMKEEKKITRIDSNNTKNGLYIFNTITGSEYVLKITDEIVTLKRNPKNKTNSLRKDGEEIRVIEFDDIELDKSATFLLEGLGQLIYTERFTSKVISIRSIL